MGFTNTLGYMYVKRVPLSDLSLNKWKQILAEFDSALGQRQLDGAIPAKWISDSDADLVLSADHENYDAGKPIRVRYVANESRTLIDDELFYCLFEDGCPTQFENVEKRIQRTTFPVDIIKRNSVYLSKEKGAPDTHLHILCGGFGQYYPGSMGGGARCGARKTSFNFDLNLKCLEKYETFNLIVMNNELKVPSYFEQFDSFYDEVMRKMDVE